MKRKLLLYKISFFVFYFFLGITSLMAQDQKAKPLEIQNIQLGNTETCKCVHVFLKINDKKLAQENLKKEDFQVIETQEGANDVYKADIEFLTKTGNDTLQEDIHVLFLMDLSGSMLQGTKLEDAKKAIKDFLNEDQNRSKTYFSYFHNDISETEVLTKDNYEVVVGGLSTDINKHTDLYYALNSKIDEMNNNDKYQGRKVIILLTDGANDLGKDEGIPNPNYYGTSATRTPVTREDVRTKVRSLDDNFAIYTIGVLGGDVEEDFLREIPNSLTKYPTDKYQIAKSEDLSGIYKDIAQAIASDLRLQIYPKDLTYFEGIKRRMIIKLTVGEEASSSKYYTFGGATNKIDITRPQNWTTKKQIDVEGFQAIPFNTFLTPIAVGIALLFVLLILLMSLFPALQDIFFKRRYVKTFQEYKESKKLNVTKVTCPVTLDELDNNDRVVVGCANGSVISVEGWREGGTGGGCGSPNPPKNCPICAGGDKNKSKRPTTKEFFNQQGSTTLKYVNWLWFGALGAFITWLLLTLTTQIDMRWHEAIFENFLKEVLKSAEQTAHTFHTDALTGMFLGLGLALVFTYAESPLQKRGVIIKDMFIKGLMSMFLGWFIFSAVAFLFLNIFNFPYLGHLVSWLLFGTGLGYILTLRSGIPARNGIIAGAIGSVIAFHVYFILVTLVQGSELGRVVSFILYGSVLGFGMAMVINSLEAYQLEITQPFSHQGQIIRLSKYLDQNKVLIGSSAKLEGDYKSGQYVTSRIIVDWDDKVAGHHLEFYLNKDKKKVYVKALAEPTEINGRSINTGNERELSDSDYIKIGNDTAFQYQEKTKEEVQQNTQQGGQTDGSYISSVTPTPTSGAGSKIKITIKKSGNANN